eukprot:6174247-Pleurochrysis_carterae.AAC.1
MAPSAIRCERLDDKVGSRCVVMATLSTGSVSSKGYRRYRSIDIRCGVPKAWRVDEDHSRIVARRSVVQLRRTGPIY